MRRIILISVNALILLVFSSSSFAVTLLFEDFETDDGGFTSASDVGISQPWTYNGGNWSVNGNASGDNSFHVSSTLTSPTVNIPTSGYVTVNFEHLYSFESGNYGGPLTCWDAGAVYVSVNGGAFTRVDQSNFLDNGYSGVAFDWSAYYGYALDDFDGGDAFCGDSPSVVSTFYLDLNAGDTLTVQFFGHWDPASFNGDPNWLINQVSINAPPVTGTVTVDDGGTVATSDQSVVIDVAPGSVDGDTAIEIDQETPLNPDVVVGNSSDFDTALALYEFGPDGTTFDPPALLTLTIDVTALTELQRSLISVYRREDTDFDSDIDEDDGFVMIAGTECSIEENPVGTFWAICVAPIEHFSTYAIISLNDSDEDGVDDSDDVCPAMTSIPEATVPSVRLGTNRFALIDGDGAFDTSVKGKKIPNTYTIEDTAGCSCEQIIAELGLGKGHEKFGCSNGVMNTWVRSVSP